MALLLCPSACIVDDDGTPFLPLSLGSRHCYRSAQRGRLGLHGVVSLVAAAVDVSGGVTLGPGVLAIWDVPRRPRGGIAAAARYFLCFLAAVFSAFLLLLQ